MSLEALVTVCTHDPRSGSGLSPCLRASGNTVNFSVPSIYREAGFPIADTSFNVENVIDNPTAAKMIQAMPKVVSNFTSRKENVVVFGYGVRAVPKRQVMYGSKSEEGYATKMMADVVASKKGIFAISAYVVGMTEHLIDLINAENQLGVIVESVKEGPRVRMLERARVTSASDVRDVMKKVVTNYEKIFAPVLLEKQPTPELEALPPYNGDTIMVQLYYFEDEPQFADYRETNSMTFIALGDAERPTLCGVDAEQQVAYEKNHRVLVSAAGIVSSIKCSRLRIPFGKSKVSQLLRRCYNLEKGYELSANNGNTSTFMFIHCSTDGKWTEENYHELTMIRRIANPLASSGIGSLLRDLTVDKWRLDQDVAELRDELTVAKAVYEYKPRIFETSKTVANIKEEELKHLTAIQAKRDELREKQLALIRQKAVQESAQAIKDQEVKNGATLAELKRTLENKKKDNASLQKELDAHVKEHETRLEKTRAEKEDQEALTAALKEEMVQLEEDLATRQAALQGKQKQLDLAKMDKEKGRDAINREHAQVQATRRKVLEQRKAERQQWIQQIKDVNQKVLEQIRTLAEDRKQSGEETSAKDVASEKAVQDDIKTIEEYLPKLITLSDVPENPEETESIRRQFDDIFSQEKQTYLQKIAEEKQRKAKLEKGLETYRNKVLEVAQVKIKESQQDAFKKEQHLTTLVDQVMAYLRQGTKLTKISSKGQLRRRFYFISEDGKKIFSCEIDNQGSPVNRKKPPVTINVHDIRKVVLGCYTPSFTSFATESALSKSRASAIWDQGTFRQDPTQSITPSNLGLNNYRSFALLLPGGKSLEVVCDSDTDCEAWMVGLKRILNVKSKVERVIESRIQEGRVASDEQMCEMRYGENLDIRHMNGFASISAEEGILCSERHVPPALLLRIKKEMIEKSKSCPITVYDVRVASGLDLVRSCWVYDYLIERKHVPLPL